MGFKELEVISHMNNYSGRLKERRHVRQVDFGDMNDGLCTMKSYASQASYRKQEKELPRQYRKGRLLPLKNFADDPHLLLQLQVLSLDLGDSPMANGRSSLGTSRLCWSQQISTFKKDYSQNFTFGALNDRTNQPLELKNGWSSQLASEKFAARNHIHDVAIWFSQWLLSLRIKACMSGDRGYQLPIEKIWFWFWNTSTVILPYKIIAAAILVSSTMKYFNTLSALTLLASFVTRVLSVRPPGGDTPLFYFVSSSGNSASNLLVCVNSVLNWVWLSYTFHSPYV